MMESGSESPVVKRRRSLLKRSIELLKEQNRKSLDKYQLLLAQEGGLAELPALPKLTPLSLENVDDYHKFLGKLIYYFDHIDDVESDSGRADVSKIEGLFGRLNDDVLKPFCAAHYGIAQGCDEYIRVLESKRPGEELIPGDKLATGNEFLSGDDYSATTVMLIKKLRHAHHLLNTYKDQSCKLLEPSQRKSHSVPDAASVLAKKCGKAFALDSPHLGEQFRKDIGRMGRWAITVASRGNQLFMPDTTSGFLKLNPCDKNKKVIVGGEPVLLQDIMHPERGSAHVFPIEVINAINAACQQQDEHMFTFQDPLYDFQQPMMEYFCFSAGKTEMSIHFDDATGEVVIGCQSWSFHDIAIGEESTFFYSPSAEIPLFEYSYELTIDPPGSPLRDDGRNWGLEASYIDNTADQRFAEKLLKFYRSFFTVNRKEGTCSVTPAFAALIRAAQQPHLNGSPGTAGMLKNTPQQRAGGVTRSVNPDC